MKTLTCREMGGMCDTAITADSKGEMLVKGMEHIEEAHPEMAVDIKKMSPTDPLMLEWQEKFDATYDAAPEM